MGVKEVMCIRVLGGFNRKFVNIGDVIVCFVKDVILGGVVKKGDVVKVVIVRICKGVRREDGIYIRFDDNVVVLIREDGILRGICIFGFVVREFCDKDFMKIVFFVLEVL